MLIQPRCDLLLIPFVLGKLLLVYVSNGRLVGFLNPFDIIKGCVGFNVISERKYKRMQLCNIGNRSCLAENSFRENKRPAASNRLARDKAPPHQ